jgi:hypothetical protein
MVHETAHRKRACAVQQHCPTGRLIEHNPCIQSTIKFVCLIDWMMSTDLGARSGHAVAVTARIGTGRSLPSFSRAQQQEELMFKMIEYERPTRRRDCLMLVGAIGATAGLLSADITVLATEDQHHVVQVAAKRQSRNQTTSQTSATLRDLWIAHIFWVRSVSLAALDKNDAAIKAAEQQAVANAKSIAASIEPFYGAAARDVFFKLLAGHYGAVKAYLVATIGNNPSGQAAAVQSLTANAEQIAVFLSKANSYLPKDTLNSLLQAHGGHHIQQIQELKARDYVAEAKTWEAMKNHVYQIADATAEALTKQFPERF